MTKEQAYFLELVKSHLNNLIPEAPTDIDYSELFKVCEIQNMTAIAAIQLKKLPAEVRPSKSDFSPFNQVIGLTLQNYEYKAEGITLLTEAFCRNKIKHLFLKGVAIRELYPVPEVRTSGDADVIVEPNELQRATGILLENGFTLKQQSDIQSVMFYHGEEYEIKNNIDYLSEKVREYFADAFDYKAETKDGFTYSLKSEYHLVYIVSHMLRHFKSGGAGIRQLCDIDIILRKCDINLPQFFNIAKELGFEKSAKVLISLAEKYFNTPVDFEYEIDETLLSTLDEVLLNGGTFGYGIGNIGTARLMNTMSTSKSSRKSASVKALFSLFKVNKESLYHTYKYAREHHILLPVAYVSRLYSAVFKRGGQNIRHIKSMFTDREIASKMSDMLKELEIN